jgi:hypothetical protein
LLCFWKFKAMKRTVLLKYLNDNNCIPYYLFQYI